MTVGDVARRLLPAVTQDAARVVVDAVVPSRRHARRAQRARLREGDPLTRKLSPDGTVLAGPFAGLWLPERGTWGGNTARVAGTYENEIAGHVERLIGLAPPVVIDAGAAEGYYAVGFARALPSSRVYAYEIDAESRRLCRQVAKRNDVRNVTVRGRITPNVLQRRLVPGALVLADVEGYEAVLLDPKAAPGLRAAHVLVELHEFAVPGVTEAILSRFRRTHHIDLIDAEPRTGREVPHLAHLTPDEADQAVQEGRPTSPPMQWAAMTPLQLGDGRIPCEWCGVLAAPQRQVRDARGRVYCSEDHADRAWESRQV